MNTSAFWHFIRQHPFPRFCLVGGTGFVIDASILVLLHYVLGIGTVAARICSFSVALTTTWMLNRKITFSSSASPKKFQEWGRYTLVNGIGGALNLGAFFFMTQSNMAVVSEPLAALLIASTCALLFNYIGSRTLVFTANRSIDSYS